MKKSFKKAIAVLLAVLMVAFSVPFNAYAVVGEDRPNIDIMFGTFHTADALTRNEVPSGKTALPDLMTCALADAPLDFDYTLSEDGLTKTGYLTLSADKANAVNEAYGSYDTMTEDYTYGVGDYFTITLTLDNVKYMSALMAAVGYSDNIEPACMYSYRSGVRTYYTFGAKSEVPSNATIRQDTIWNDMSAMNLYAGIDSLLGTASVVRDEQNYIWLQKTAQENVVDGMFELTPANGMWPDPATGIIDLDNGYTYTDKAIMETYIFKIVGEGPISVSCYDPDDSKMGGFQGGFYIGDSDEGIMLDQVTTYAINTTNYENRNPNNDENVGSRKMTYWGINIYNMDTPTCDHANAVAVDAKAATCTSEGNTAYWHCPDCDKYFSDSAYATEITLADTVIAINPDAHAYGAYVSNNDGTHTATCAYNAAHVDTVACTYSSEVTKEPTYTEPGVRTYTCSVCGYSYTEEIPANVCDHADTTVVNAKEATCTEEGYTGDTVCNTCGQTIATGTVIEAKGHTPVSANNAVAATCTEAGKEADTVCDVCGTVLEEGAVIEALGHNYVETSRVEPTYDTNGSVTYTCTRCDASYTETIPMLSCDHADTTVVGAKEATCTEDGYTGDTVCNTCGTTIATGEVITAKGHTPVSANNAVAATCTEAGKEADTVCDVCGTVLEEGAVIEALGHNYVETSRVEPTYEAAGSVTYTCTRCDASYTDEIPALTGGVKVSVTATDLGTTTINGADATYGLTSTVAKNSTVTLTATHAEGAEFVGWALNNKIVSTEANYTVTALADVTYTPVFTATADTTFTVVFVDKYGNVISTQAVAEAAEIVEPTAPAVPGYTFTGWDVDYTALTAGATITAQYEKNAADTYTVTSSDAVTITSSAGASATGTLADVAYDTQVTVTADGATAWTIDGATVAYGDTYSFYVGSDVTVLPVFDAVTAAPTVAAVSVSDVTDASGMTKAVFLATRSMTDDCTLVSAGYIYGKAENVTAATTLDDVDGTTVKRLEAKTTAEQFGITYGLRAQSGSVAAKAYLAYVDASGATQVIYADLQTYTYA